MSAPAIDQARQLHAGGVELSALGRPSRAVRLFDQALRTLDGADSREAERLRGRVWLSSAMSRAELAGAAAAEDSLARASTAAEAAADQELAVLVRAQRGVILMRAGEFGQAVPELEAAIAGRAEVPGYDRCLMLLNRGTLAMLQGELRTAEQYLPEAVEIARRDGFRVAALQATHNLAYVRFLAGDLPAALHGMDDALALVPDLDSGIPLLDRARVLVEAGLITQADRTLAEAASVFRRARLAQDLAETELERARCALIEGDAERARRLAMRARDRFRRRGADRWQRSAELVLLQGDLAAGRPGRRLTGPALRLQAQFRGEGARLPAQTAALIAAEAQLTAGEPDGARQALRSLGRTDLHDPITARLHAHYVRARLDAATGRRAAAVRRARAALDELAVYQSGFGSIDLATAAAVHGRRLAELDLSIALESGRPAAVFAASERARAVINRLPAVRPPADPQTADLLADLRQVLESGRGVETDRAAAADAQRRDLEQRIAARGWTRAGGGVVLDVTGLDDVRSELGAATLVSFTQVGGRLHAVVVDGALRLVPLGAAGHVQEYVRRVRADLDVLAAARLPAPLAGAVSASLTRSLAALDAELIAPLRLRGPLVIVSTGVLVQLPWGLLPSLRHVPVVVAPSATAWHRARTRPAAGRGGVVAIAGPGLARSTAEAEQVARVWDASAVADADAAAFAAALADARIVHVAAHGVHQPDNPLFSSVRLADGPLFAHELDQSARTPEHVVLSACEVGLATVRPGDEALGLTSVFLHLGTRCVVAGVARVGDELAAAVMSDYHARLRAGADSAGALAEVVANHPTVPFVCFGAAFAAA